MVKQFLFVGVIALSGAFVVAACSRLPARPVLAERTAPGFQADESGFTHVGTSAMPLEVMEAPAPPEALVLKCSANFTPGGMLEVEIGWANNSETPLRIIPIDPDSHKLYFRANGKEVRAFNLAPGVRPVTTVRDLVELPRLHTLSTTYYVPDFQARFPGVDAYRVSVFIQWLADDGRVASSFSRTEWVPLEAP
jgi:hypothetical protein